MLVAGLLVAASMVNPADIIVPLQSLGSDGNGLSAGFMIDETHMMTAAHSVSRVRNTLIAICGAKKIIIDNDKIVSDPLRDIAVITLDEKCKQKPLKLAKTNPNPGDDLYAIGCPEEQENCGLMTRGIMSMMQSTPGGLHLVSDLKIWYGNSGGPVVNSAGELVGIVIEIKNMSRIGTSRLGVVTEVGSQNYSVITPISEIATFLKNYL